MVQALASFTELFIKTGFLPDICLMGAAMHLDHIKGHLEKLGVVWNFRRNAHIYNLIRSCAMYEAIKRVFCTTEVFQPNTPFEFHHLQLLEPYLFATEEHVVFTLTMLEEVLIDQNLDLIVAAIWDLSTSEGGMKVFRPKRGGKHEGTGGGGGVGGVGEGDGGGYEPQYDFNYYFVRLANIPRQPDMQAVILDATARMICNHILSQGGPALLQDNVKSVLTKMTQNTKTYRAYDGHDPVKNLTNRDVTLPQASIVFGETAQNGMAFTRQLIDTKRNSTESLLDQALRNSQSRNTIQRRLITGRTFRKPKELYPQFFQMMNREPNMAKTTTIRNLNDRAEGFREMLSEEKDLIGPIISIDTDIDSYCYGEFLLANGIDTDVCFPVDMVGASRIIPSLDKSYPEEYISDYKKKIELIKESQGLGGGGEGKGKKRSAPTTTVTNPDASHQKQKQKQLKSSALAITIKSSQKEFD